MIERAIVTAHPPLQHRPLGTCGLSYLLNNLLLATWNGKTTQGEARSGLRRAQRAAAQLVREYGEEALEDYRIGAKLQILETLLETA